MAGKLAQAEPTGGREIPGRRLRNWRHAEQVRVLACLVAPVLLAGLIGCGVDGPECEVDTDCDDGVACTADTCVSAIGLCASFEIDTRCDDGFFCNGDEICIPDRNEADEDGCLFTADPCGGTTPVCDETADACEPCSDAADCSDDIPCTDDSCDADGSCTNAMIDSNCPDPDFCDGIDGCDPTDEDSDADGCVAPGNPCDELTPICDEEADTCIPCISDAECEDVDGVPCTDDVCQADGSCSSTPNDGNCPDPLFCDGIDVCDPTSEEADADGCYAPGNPCPELNPICIEEDATCRPCISDTDCGDGIPCTDDMCIEDTGACDYPPTDCDDGEICTADSCDSVSGGCVNAAIPGCCTTDDECHDGDGCTDDACNTDSGACENTPVDCPDGDVCNPATGECEPPCETKADCTDGDPCTTNVCDTDTGQCLYPGKNCDDGNDCTTDGCGNGGCFHDVLPVCHTGVFSPKLEINNFCSFELCACAGDVAADIDGDGEEDFPCDGVVDDLDLDAIMQRFGLDPCSEETCKYDVTCDGIIDALDSGFVLSRFGTCHMQTGCDVCDVGFEACCYVDDDTGNECQDTDPVGCMFLEGELQGKGTSCAGGDCEGSIFCPDCDDSDACTTDACVDGACENTEMDCDDGDVCTDDSCVDGGCVNAEIEGCCDTPALCDGDVNGDEVVDLLDSGAVLARFGLDPCEVGNCPYDVNCDGIIDARDSGYVLTRFGTCDPVPNCDPPCRVENNE